MNHPSLNTAKPPGRSAAPASVHERDPLKAVAPLAILAAATLAAHGWSLLDGAFLDDHLHLTRYASPDWSVRHLLEATTIVPEEFMDTWWQDVTIRWQYARPFSVLVSKVVYQFTGGSVKALHALSLALHWVGAVLVFRLCLLLTRRAGWSLVGGLLFVIHSHSVYAVGWLAAQNSVLQTVLTLGALLSYIRASRLNVYAGAADSTRSGDAGAPTLQPNAPPLQDWANDSRSSLTIAPSFLKGWGARPHPLKGWGTFGWWLLVLVLWALALCSRENALVFPAFAAMFEVAFGGWRRLRSRAGVFMLMGGIAAAFAFWRLKLSYVPMPAFYFRLYDGPEYVGWWLAKLLHWITGVVWLSPLMIGPSARYSPFREVPGDCALMMAIIGMMALGYILACRRARGWWIWPAWILLSLLPVVPVFAGPQSAYMPAVGYAVGMILGPALRREIHPVSIGRWSPQVAVWFLVATSIYMPIYQTFWRAVQAAERLTIAQMAADPPPPDAEVFLINLPFVNIYTSLHLQEELGGSARRSSRCHVLTYAPNVLRMDEDCRLEQLDAHSFRLSVAGRGYFSGALGRFLIESMRPAGRLRVGDQYEREHFHVQVTRANAEGVQELQFRFREPLASPGYSFYIGTNRRAATRVHFQGAVARPPSEASTAEIIDAATIQAAADRLHGGAADAARALFKAMDHASTRDRAVAIFRQAALPVARALAAGEQDLLASPDWSASDQVRLQSWWDTCVNNRNLAVARGREPGWEVLRRRRDRLFAIQQIAARIIRTDLYLTGPPFPGPR